jgi:hypothetical protein
VWSAVKFWLKCGRGRQSIVIYPRNCRVAAAVDGSLFGACEQKFNRRGGFFYSARVNGSLFGAVFLRSRSTTQFSPRTKWAHLLHVPFPWVNSSIPVKLSCGATSLFQNAARFYFPPQG